MELLAACQKTLEDNGHLADGDNCTLIELKRAVAKVEATAALEYPLFDRETGIWYREVERREVNGLTWVYLAHRHSEEWSRTVSLGVFNTLFAPLPSAPITAEEKDEKGSPT